MHHRLLPLTQRYGGVLTVFLTLILTLIMVRWMGLPISRDLADVHLTATGDTWLNSWTLYQAFENLRHWPINLGYSEIFYPVENSFAYTIAPYGIAIFSFPLYLLSGENLILTYNVYLLLTYPLTAWATYVLVKYLFKAPWGIALLAALMVTFNPFRVSHLSHIETSSFQFMIIALYFLHRLLDRPRFGWAVCLSVAYFFSFTSNAYFGFFLALMIAIIVIYTGVKHWRQITSRLLIHLALSAALVALFTAPFFLLRADLLGGDVPMRIVYLRSASLGNWLFSPSMLHEFLYETLDRQLAFLYPPSSDNTPVVRLIGPGVGVVLLGVAGMYAAWRNRRTLPDDEGGESPRLLSQQDVVWVYGLIALIGFLLSFGPQIFISEQIHFLSPYSWIINLPGFSQIRAPRRFAILTDIGLVIASVYWLKQFLSQPGRRKQRVAILVGIVLLLGIEMTPVRRSLRHDPLPAAGPVYDWLAGQPADTAVFHLPSDKQSIVHILTYQSIHHVPMLTGAGSFFPSGPYEMWWTFDPGSVEDMIGEDTLQTILDRGGDYVILHLGLLSEKQRQQFHDRLDSYTGTPYLELVETLPDAEIYVIRATRTSRNDFTRGRSGLAGVNCLVGIRYYN